MKLSQIIIFFLLVANLVATILFGLNDNRISNISTFENNSRDVLPKHINEEVRNNLFEKLSTAFNSSDYDSLYSMLGSDAKAKISKEIAFKEFEKLIKYFHSIESGVYTKSKLIGLEGDTSMFAIDYAVILSENSEFGTSAILKIILSVQGSEYQVYGFRINTG